MKIAGCLLVVLLSFSQSILALEKADPAGIICLMGPSRSITRNVSSAGFWSKKEVDGVRLRSGWSKIQPDNKDSYDWSLIDDMLVLARSHGKFIGISVAAGKGTPQWVYDAGVESFSFTRKHKRPKNSGVANTPLPWDPEFQNRWEAFLAEMGQRYDNDPQFAYVVMAGFGPVVETYFVRTRAGLEKFNALGGLEKWVEGSKKIIDIYARSFTKTPFILTMASPVRGREGSQALQRVVQYGRETYPGRFGVMNTALNAQSSMSSEINKTIFSLSKSTPVGFQMVWATVGRNAGWIKGTLAEALENADQLGAHYVEVYRRDIENKEYSATLKVAGEKLKSNAQ